MSPSLGYGNDLSAVNPLSASKLDRVGFPSDQRNNSMARDKLICVVHVAVGNRVTYVDRKALGHEFNLIHPTLNVKQIFSVS